MDSRPLAASSDDSENVPRDLTINDKGKFRWSGTFEHLEAMMNSILDTQTVWTSSGGDCKKMELDDLCVRWYTKNKSLTINGAGSEDLKSQLRAVIYVMGSDAEVNQQRLNVDEVLEKVDVPECESVLLSSSPKSSNIQSLNDSASVLELMQRLEHRLESKFEKLANQIHELNSASSRQVNYELSDASQSTEHNVFLKNENTSLKKENARLAEQVNGYKMIVSDLNAKIKDLDNEKLSLVTAIKILHEDKKCHETEPSNERQNGNSPALKNNSSKAVRSTNHFEVQTQNRFSILSDTDNDELETLISQKRHESGTIPVTKDTVMLTENSIAKNGNATDHRSAEIILIGDSIIKHIEPRKLTKKKVNKYTYPGKTSEDIEAELGTIKNNSTPSHVIIHAGTNDIPVESAEVCAKKIESLVLKTKSKFPSSKIEVSGITTRQDIEVGQNINKVNKKLEDLSKKHNISFIDNCNINNTCLNNSMLHLNAKGSAFLATNFIRFLKGDQHMSIRKPRRRSAEDFHTIANQLLMTLLAGTSRTLR